MFPHVEGGVEARFTAGRLLDGTDRARDVVLRAGILAAYDRDDDPARWDGPQLGPVRIAPSVSAGLAF